MQNTPDKAIFGYTCNAINLGCFAKLTQMIAGILETMTTLNVLFSQPEVAERVNNLATQLSSNLDKDNTLVISLLKGSFMFVADLARALHDCGFQPQFDFMRVSSYGNSKTSSGKVKIINDFEISVQDKEILLIDDIVDSGRTMKLTKQLLRERGAKKVITCALLDKPARRAVECHVDFIGFEIDDLFVVGYGIDYAENYRHLPYIGYITD